MSLDEHNQSNHSSIVDCLGQIRSIELFMLTRKINIYVTFVIIFVGLIGNGLAVMVFAQKRFRLHSSSIYLLGLAISDGLFLLMHLFEDTLRAFIDANLNGDEYQIINQECLKYVENQNNEKIQNSFLRMVNITDRFESACRLINYFRYFLRFISAYIIVAFTIQRAIAIYSPLLINSIESNKNAWFVVTVLSLTGFFSNIWVPFFFGLREEEKKKDQGNFTIEYCDVQNTFSGAYFTTTIIYISLIMLVPILIIFFCNALIIIQILRARKNRKTMYAHANCKYQSVPQQQKTRLNYSSYLNLNEKKANELVPLENNLKEQMVDKSEQKQLSNKSLDSPNKEQLLLPNKQANNPNFKLSNSSIAITNNHSSNNINNASRKPADDINKITQMLIITSLSYAILNLPYFCSWCLFFYHMAFRSTQSIEQRYILFSYNNITEIFYVLNYGIHFFIYCASGKRFRSQLKNVFRLKK
jgi:hypothetical protein